MCGNKQESLMSSGFDMRLRELADFIRVRRDRLVPDGRDLGADAGRRRVPGLRREELGRLSGLSADWIARLEQGRDIKLSPPAADRLARALQLDAVETEHLLALAGGHDKAGPDGGWLPPALRAIVDAQGGNPAYVADQCGDLLVWNKAAGMVFDDFGRDALGRANLLWFMFLYEGSRRTIVGWEQYASRIVAQFRLRHDRTGDSGRLADLACELRRQSAEFEALWVAHDVCLRATGRKVVRNGALGELSFQYCNFQVEGSPGLTLTLLVPASGCNRTGQAMQQALAAAPWVGAPIPG